MPVEYATRHGKKRPEPGNEKSEPCTLKPEWCGTQNQISNQKRNQNKNIHKRLRVFYPPDNVV